MTTSEAEPEFQFDDIEQQHHADAMGIWVFLATEMLLFGAVFVAFAVYRTIHAEVFAAAAHHLDLRLGAINTAILLTTGLTTRLTELSVHAGRRLQGLWLLIATIVLGFVFLGIKLYEWYVEYTHNLMPALGLEFVYPGPKDDIASLFFNFYYTLTGLHGAHMVIGLGVLIVVAVQIFRWRDPHRVSRQVHISGLYWAFVDVVWIFVFTALYLLHS